MENLLLFSKDMLQKHQLCFVHIPKTAGSSFTNILIRTIGQTRFRIVFPDILHGVEEPDFDINTYSGISGHFPYEIKNLMLKPALFLTFLREPLSRSFSHFNQFQRMSLDNLFVKRSKNYHYYEQVNKMTFEEFIEHPFFGEEISNLQTRMLGLFINHPIHQLKQVMPIAKADDRFFSLELAKERLEQFAFVGIQEKFQESLDIFCYQFGIRPVKTPPQLNVSPDKAPLVTPPEKIVEKLRELNILDIELYEFGQKLFIKRYDEMMSMLQKKYQQTDNYSVYELLSQKFDKENTISDFPYRYEFEEIYPRTGWYPVERVNDRQWAWSGPNTTSTIDLPISRINNLRVQFQITHYIELDVLENLELCIDGEHVHLIHTKENGIYLFTGVIAANLEKKYTSTQFSFHVTRTTYPLGMTAESTGARLLGVALTWMEISPEKDYSD